MFLVDRKAYHKVMTVSGGVRIPVAYALRSGQKDIVAVTQEANAALINAADSYRCLESIPFSTFAKYYVASAISDIR